MFRIITAICFLTYLIARRSNTVFHRNSRVHLKNTHLRVLNGRNIGQSEYPFVIILFELHIENFHPVRRFCTGSVIAKHWVLTAAHCVKENVEKNIKFFVWYNNFTVPPSDAKSFSKVLNIYIHPAYRELDLNDDDMPFLSENDLCLLRVNKMDMKSYGRLSAVDHTTMIGLPVTYVGGGGTNDPKKDSFRPLQVGEAVITACNEEMNSGSKYLICIMPKCSNRLQMPWFGDSGGPLIHDGVIVGVCSFGFNTSIMGNDGYAPVSPYLDWIYGVMHAT